MGKLLFLTTVSIFWETNLIFVENLDWNIENFTSINEIIDELSLLVYLKRY